MALPTTTFLWNVTTNDGANTGNAAGGTGADSSIWFVMDRTNDVVHFLSEQQTDGDSMTGTMYPVIIPAAGTIEAPKTFVKDHSAGIFWQVPLAGTTDGGQSGGNTRHVFCIFVSGDTATVPYLEAWDDNTHAATDSTYLGAGTAADSTLRAISTTDAAPGSATWTGTPLAGTDSRIELASGAISGETNMYFNIKQVIANTFSPATDSDVVLTLRFTYS